MNAKLKSITPIRVRKGHYEFDVEVEIDRKLYTAHLSEAEQLFDFQQCREAVANQTGGFLTGKRKWEKVLAKAYKNAKKAPESSDDITCDNDSPLTPEEIEALPKDLRDICESEDEMERERRNADNDSDA